MAELRAGNRLLVAVDAEPARALALLRSVDGVRSVRAMNGQGVGHRYALDLDGDNGLTDTAPRIASRITAEGLKLYALQPESRDLETIFGEISAR
jgi:ABC-2 type transport system ATP-binding protein